MKYISIWTIYLLLTVSCYSQTILQNYSLKKTDTAFCVSVNDIKLYNHAIADLDACNELADSLYSQIHNQELSAIQKNDLILIGQLMVSKLEAQVLEKTVTEESYIKEAKKNSNKLKLFKGLLNLVSAVAIIELGWIGVQSLKN